MPTDPFSHKQAQLASQYATGLKPTHASPLPLHALQRQANTRFCQEGQEQPSVHCPFCGSAEVELLALFGSQLLTDQYYCRVCHTPFEHLRADADDDERAGPAHPAHQGE